MLDVIETDAEIIEKVAQAVKAIQDLPNLTIEVAGVWVWVSGNTKPHVEALKAAQYRWAPKKKMWYFAGRRSAGRGKDMSYIRSKYGSIVVKESTK